MNEPDYPILFSLFEGCRIDTVFLDEGPLWRCSQVGGILGYPDEGRRLAVLVTTDWGAEFRRGEHYLVLSGRALAPSADPSTIPPQCVLLTPRGLDLVLLKTPSETSARLRAFVDERILPHTRRTHAAPPGRPLGILLVIVTITRTVPPEAEPEARPSRRPTSLLAALRQLLAERGPRPLPDVNLCTLADVADIAGVPEAEVARAVRRLGFRGLLECSRPMLRSGSDGRPSLEVGFTVEGVCRLLNALGDVPLDGAA